MMIKQFIKSLFLIDVLRALWMGAKVALSKRPVTIKLPRQKVPRCSNFRRKLTLEHSKCVACKICEGVCPCGALTIIDSKTHRFTPKRCVYCGLCQKACPKGAVWWGRN